jgi:phage tail-like protein
VAARLQAKPEIRADRIHLSLSWTGTEQYPELQLRRRRHRYPTDPGDGLPIVDFADLYAPGGDSWTRIEQILFLIPKTPKTSAALQAMPAQRRIEHSLIQARVELYFAAEEDIPARARLAWYDVASTVLAETVIDQLSRLEHTVLSDPDWAQVEHVALFATPDGGPETAAGEWQIFHKHIDGTTPDRLIWSEPGKPAVTVDFDYRERLHTQRTQVSDTLQAYLARFQTTVADMLLRFITVETCFDENSGKWRSQMNLSEVDLEPENVYYYALFIRDPTVPQGYRSDHHWQAAAMATGRYGLEERLYGLLPAMHQQYDEPSAIHRGRGQLRRFLQIFGLVCDQLRSQTESLHSRHNVLEVRAELLPQLARGIGWAPDQTLDALTQRRDILFAPEVYDSIGTGPNARALVHRVTGWECRTKEFVHNVFLTNAPETVHLWEIWERRHNGSGWSTATALTHTDGHDGRPTAAVDQANRIWLFWHAKRAGRREIWLQRLNGVDATPRRAMGDAPDDVPGLLYADEQPAAVAEGGRIRLFWSSNRHGAWDLWTRTYEDLPGGAPESLTEHPANDCHPTALQDAAGRLWVFWQSDRRGPTEIWARRHNGSQWGPPTRITRAEHRHEMPAATLDGAGRIWLFWTADLGERRLIQQQTYDEGEWSAPEDVTEGHRDEAPAAVFWDGKVWLFWHAWREGRWQIQGRSHNGAGWDPPLLLSDYPTADKEPAAVVDSNGDLRLLWRSQRRGHSYKSRTIDTDDSEMLAQLGSYEDRSHYTYDTGQDNQAWYARDAVGLYVNPDTADTELINRQIERTQDFIEPFRALPVRFVWPKNVVFEEIIDTDGLIEDGFTDDITES